MASVTVVVGFICGLCGSRVPVLNSASVPPPKVEEKITARCSCGASREIKVDMIQSLEVWREG
jgi:hypothetical protein